MRRQILLLSAALAVGACPPQLTGAPCDLTGANSNDCPTGQACVAASDGGGVCVSGATFGDSGVPDSGTGPADAGRDAGMDAGTDAGMDGGEIVDAGPDGGGAVFAGNVVLNGGAAPVDNAWVYGFEGPPNITDAGVTNQAFFATADAGGTWAVGGPVTENGYYFAAQYDITGTGNSQQINPGDFVGVSALTGISQPNALDLTIDVETSTCQSYTAEIEVDGGPPELTVLLGLSAQVYNIQTDSPFTAAIDLSIRAADFDAGGATVPGGPPSTFALVPSNGSWVYTPPTGGVAVSNQGAFTFRFGDTGVHTPPQYPNGTCLIGYNEPPGFPAGVSVSASGFGNKATWSDANVTLMSNVVFAGDVVSITDASGNVVYSTPSGSYDTSPLTFGTSSFAGSSGCGVFSGKYCYIEVVSFYEDILDARRIAAEGGAVFFPFQTT